MSTWQYHNIGPLSHTIRNHYNMVQCNMIISYHTAVMEAEYKSDFKHHKNCLLWGYNGTELYYEYFGKMHHKLNHVGMAGIQIGECNGNYSIHQHEIGNSTVVQTDDKPKYKTRFDWHSAVQINLVAHGYQIVTIDILQHFWNHMYLYSNSLNIIPCGHTDNNSSLLY